MAITIRLNAETYKHYKYALEKGKVEITDTNPPAVDVTAENIEPILKALRAMHVKNLNLKTKTVVHMERLYALEHVIGQIEALAIYFPSAQAETEEEDAAEVEAETPTETDETEAGEAV